MSHSSDDQLYVHEASSTAAASALSRRGVAATFLLDYGRNPVTNSSAEVAAVPLDTPESTNRSESEQPNILRPASTMTKPSIEFVLKGEAMYLVYRPRDGVEWVHRKLHDRDDLVLKGTFHLALEHLEDDQSNTSDTCSDALEDEWAEEDGLCFKIGTLIEDYYRIDPKVLGFETPVLLHKAARPTWKWFSAERKVSIPKVIQSLGLERIVIGGQESDSIPIAEYERLLRQLPTPYEISRYVQARVSSVVKQYGEPSVDAEATLNRYVNRRTTLVPPSLGTNFRAIDAAKFTLTLARLKGMLADESGTSEAQWQVDILEIILLLNPKYIRAFKEVIVWDADTHTRRRIDILLVDASGNVDVIEIKKPMGKPIMLPTRYRDHHLPLRDLVGAMGQATHYLRHLYRWGSSGEEHLSRQLARDLPSGFRIRIINPSAIIIMGRSNTLTEAQRRDFEVLRRDSKGVIDIITYDDLLGRLSAVLDQLEGNTSITLTPTTST